MPWRSNMHGLKCGSCIFWQRTDSPPGSNKFRMVYANAAGRMPWRSNMLRLAYADSGSACKLAQDMVPTAHTQIDVRSQPLKNSAGRVPQGPRLWHALLLEMGNQCRKTTLVAHFRGLTLQCLRTSVCVPSRWKVLSGEFRRRPTAPAIKFRKSDRVGRRGLSEPREDFSRLLTFAFPWLCLSLLPQFEFCRA